MKLLFIIVGGSFRKGSHMTRNYGSHEAYDEQIKASENQIEFLKHIKNKYNIDQIDIIISTYSTKYDNDLINVYKDYLIDKNIFDYNNGKGLRGIHKLFHESYKDHLKNYDALLFLRIDIMLKQKLFDIFNPNAQTILFPFICSPINITTGEVSDRYPSGHPKPSDMLLFVPKKYFNIIDKINIGHGTWEELVGGSGGFVVHKKPILTYDDFDCMIDTYYDSDSEIECNQLYYTINRKQTNFRSGNDKNVEKFCKYDYNYRLLKK